METYTLLRAFADSWHLLFMTLFFLGMIAWVFWPGRSSVHSESANMIFRHDEAPLPEQDPEART